MPKLSECTKPHALVHLVSGAGVGILLYSLIPGLAAMGATLGVILVVAAIVGEFVWNK